MGRSVLARCCTISHFSSFFLEITRYQTAWLNSLIKFLVCPLRKMFFPLEHDVLLVISTLLVSSDVSYKTNTQSPPIKYVNIVLCKDPDSCAFVWNVYLLLQIYGDLKCINKHIFVIVSCIQSYRVQYTWIISVCTALSFWLSNLHTLNMQTISNTSVCILPY